MKNIAPAVAPLFIGLALSLPTPGHAIGTERATATSCEAEFTKALANHSCFDILVSQVLGQDLCRVDAFCSRREGGVRQTMLNNVSMKEMPTIINCDGYLTRVSCR